MNTYIPLRVKSDHSVLYGFGTIDEYIKRCKENNIKALGLSDRFNESGLHDFITKCNKENIKPIPGVELYLKAFDELTFITIFAYNNDGLRNLFKLMELSYRNKEHYTDEISFITFKQLLEHNKGNICLTGYEDTLTNHYIKKGIFSEKRENVTQYLNSLKETFKDNLYLSVEDSRDFNFRIGESFDIKLVPSHEVLFAYDEHKMPCDICKAMGVKKMTMFETDNKHGGKRPVSEFKNSMIRDDSEKGAYIKDGVYQLNDLDINKYSELYDNLNKIAEQADVSLEFNTHLRPSFALPENVSNMDYFKELIQKGFEEKRLGTKYEEESRKKIEEEIDTIAGNDFIDYFLVVSEYCKFAKEKAGGIGIGRGCFLPDNKVVVVGGKLKNINEIQVGEFVLTKDKSYRRVKNSFEYDIKEKCIKLTLSNGAIITCTLDHQIYKENDGYTEAQYLKVGDNLLGPHEEAKVINIETFDYEGKVYDIEVNRVHNYTIGGITVHNSVGGSEVAYLMDIHDTDPIRHELLFERFLSPGRGSEYTIYYEDGTNEKSMISDKHISGGKQYYTHQLESGMILNNKKIKEVKLTRPSASAVDVDTDFHTAKRDMVYEHVKELYGNENVSHVITLGTFQKLQAVKSIGTVYGIPFAYMNTATNALSEIKSLKDIFFGENKDSLESQEQRNIFKAWTNTLGEYGEYIYEYAPVIEGRIKQEGVHACAVLISKEELSNTVPMFISPKNGDLIAQWEYPLCESVGLLKMDFLGLDNVELIENTIDNINENYNLNLDKYDIINSALDDKKTYDLFSAGQTNAIFQYSSDGVKQFLRELKPRIFKDLFAVTALYRPGPMGMGAHLSYTKRKNGEEARIPFNNPKLVGTEVEKVLDETYGLITFQETLMNLARRCCGFTPYETDLLRKGTAKKKVEILVELKPKFLEGLRRSVNSLKKKEIVEEVSKLDIPNKKEYAQKLAEERFLNDQDLADIWENIIHFSEYSFNKSHSVSYALNAYIGMYLKAHYPEEFMAAALRQKSDSKKDTNLSLTEISYMDLNTRSPDVNISQTYTKAIIVEEGNEKKDVIYYGFDIIPGLTFGNKIVEEREQNGDYTSVQDFATRMNKRGLLDKTSFIALASAGAFDSLGESRKGIIDSFKIITKYVKDDISGKLPKTSGLFPEEAPANEIIIPKEDFGYLDKLYQEKSNLGFFITGHPLDKIKEGDIDRTAYKVSMEEFTKKRFKFKKIETAGTDKRGNNISSFSVYPLLVYIPLITIKDRSDGFRSISITVDTGVEEFVVYPGRNNGNNQLPLTSTGKLIQEGKIYKMLINYWNRNGRPNFTAVDIEEVIVDKKGNFKNLISVEKYIEKENYDAIT